MCLCIPSPLPFRRYLPILYGTDSRPDNAPCLSSPLETEFRYLPVLELRSHRQPHMCLTYETQWIASTLPPLSVFPIRPADVFRHTRILHFDDTETTGKAGALRQSRASKQYLLASKIHECPSCFPTTPLRVRLFANSSSATAKLHNVYRDSKEESWIW